MRQAGKVAAWLLAAWFWFVVLGLGLAGNAYMAVKLWNAGEIRGALLFCVFFGAACVGCYRIRDEIGTAVRAGVKWLTGYERPSK